MALPIRTRSSFPFIQSLSSGSFHKLLMDVFSIREQTDWKPQSQKNNQSNHIDQLALSNSVKLWAKQCRPPKTDGSWWRVLTKRGPPEKRMANHFSIFALRTPSKVWKCKKIWHWKMNSLGQLVPNMLLEKSGEKAPERMKRLSQSKTMPSCRCDWWWK